jgi:hypothetical protein
VKLLASFLLVSAAALAQSPATPKIVTFNPADKDHCKVVVYSGKPMLETTYNGTVVAVTMPQNWGNGEFSVFVAVGVSGEGEAAVNPKEVSALYPDSGHTRFVWFDKGRDLDTLASRRAAGLGTPGGAPGAGPGGPPSGNLGDSASAMPPPTHPEQFQQMDPDAGTKSAEELRQQQLRNPNGNASAPQQLDPAHPPSFLRQTTAKPGATATGYVFLHKPKGSKVEVSPTGTLDEIDIPVNGIIFRF